jgi:hypothetical protein
MILPIAFGAKTGIQLLKPGRFTVPKQEHQLFAAARTLFCRDVGFSTGWRQTAMRHAEPSALRFLLRCGIAELVRLLFRRRRAADAPGGANIAMLDDDVLLIRPGSGIAGSATNARTDRSSDRTANGGSRRSAGSGAGCCPAGFGKSYRRDGKEGADEGEFEFGRKHDPFSIDLATARRGRFPSQRLSSGPVSAWL